MAHYADRLVLRVDPESGAVRRSEEICQGPQGLAVAKGELWVVCTVDSVVLHPTPRPSSR